MNKPIIFLGIIMILFTACQSNTIPQQEKFPSPVPSLKSTQIAKITPPFVEPSNFPTSTSYVVTFTPEVTKSDKSPTPAGTDIMNNDAILVDHNFVGRFNLVPDDVLANASQLALLMRHSSVGENIRFGLECLNGNFSERRPSACSPLYDRKYDSSRWVFQFRGNPGWIDKVEDFRAETEAQQADFVVFMFTLGYLDGLDGMTYPQISTSENFNSKYIEPLEKLEESYPQKIFVWWTMSLAQEGQQNTTQFNQMLRDYSYNHQKILMDLADIESYDLEGNPCKDSEGRPIICKIYTDEKQSGHLNEVGREHIAKAFWYLMARVSGWQDS